MDRLSNIGSLCSENLHGHVEPRMVCFVKNFDSLPPFFICFVRIVDGFAHSQF